MRIPFPHALSVGTDIIAHGRLLRLLKSNKTDPNRLVRRFLHPKEILQLKARFVTWPQIKALNEPQLNRLATFLAGRWAAKEAAKKAWGAHLLSFRDLRVESAAHGEVEIVCQAFVTVDETRQRSEHDNKTELLEQVAKVSISHDGHYAVATVLASPLHPNIISTLEAMRVTIEPHGIRDSLVDERPRVINLVE